METLSSSGSTSFKLPAFHTTSREFSHFRTPNKPHPLPPLLHPHLSNKPNSISNRPTTSSTHSPFPTTTPFTPSPQPSSLKQSSLITHRKAATGYAAALVDVAISNNTIEALGRDVRRLEKFLRNEQIRSFWSDPLVEERRKGDLVKEVAEKGKFDRHLVKLLKMLVEKRKLGLVSEVLGEFGAIYNELCGTRRFTTSCKREAF